MILGLSGFRIKRPRIIWYLRLAITHGHQNVSDAVDVVVILSARDFRRLLLSKVSSLRTPSVLGQVLWQFGEIPKEIQRWSSLAAFISVCLNPRIGNHPVRAIMSGSTPKRG